MINTVVLTGRLTANPELRTTPNGTSVTAFSIAVERSYKDANGEKQTDFINVVAWKGTAEFIIGYFHKGDMIGIVGNLQSRSYTDKNGNKRAVHEVVVQSAHFCGGKTESKTENSLPDVDKPDFEEITMDDGDLPF